MKFRIFSFGCKVNQYESEFIRELLVSDGHTYASNDSEAELFVVNSCSVTAVSDAKCRRFLHRLRREHPSGIILLCGCMSQAFPRKYENFTDCDIVTGNTGRSMIPKLVRDFCKSRERIIDISDHDRKNEQFEKCSLSDFSEHTRAFLKIEDGCDCFCSYCIIPYARGRVRSKELADIKTEVEALADKGYREIVLVGINLSRYGSDIGCSIFDAVACVESVAGIERIRFGSLEPELLDEDTIIKLSQCRKFCPQFHLSLQSGCDDTLKRMNRKYTSAEYADIVELLRKHFEDSSITTDVMVGFPGEDEREFNESLNFTEKIGFAKVHVFPYSRRSGTVADRMSEQLTKAQKDERARLMSEASEKKRIEFLTDQCGRISEVLFERINKDGYYEGFTRNYTPVYVKDRGEDLSGKCHNVLLIEILNDGCLGELI